MHLCRAAPLRRSLPTFPFSLCSIPTSSSRVAASLAAGRLAVRQLRTQLQPGTHAETSAPPSCFPPQTLGVTKLVVVINKMDDPSVIEPDGTWSKARYDEVESKLTPFLRSCGYNPKKDVIFLPISGLLGLNMKERVAAATCP